MHRTPAVEFLPRASPRSSSRGQEPRCAMDNPHASPMLVRGKIRPPCAGRLALDIARQGQDDARRFPMSFRSSSAVSITVASVAGASSVLSTIDTPPAVKLTDLTSTGLDRALDLLDEVGLRLPRRHWTRHELLVAPQADHVRTGGPFYGVREIAKRRHARPAPSHAGFSRAPSRRECT